MFSHIKVARIGSQSLDEFGCAVAEVTIVDLPDDYPQPALTVKDRWDSPCACAACVKSRADETLDDYYPGER